MSFLSFCFGFASAIAAAVALLFFAGAKTRPLLSKRLEDLQQERISGRAKAVKASASVDKFKVTSIEAVQIQSTPAHISTSGVPCRIAMIGGAITLSTAYAFQKKGSSSPSSSGGVNPKATPEAQAEKPEAVSRKQDRAIATLSAKNVVCRMDRKNRSVLYIEPRAEGTAIAEVTDTVDGVEKHVKWRALTLTFSGGPREADRWFTVLNPTPATERWVRFVKSVPEGKDTSFNYFVARILFENSAETTLDDFIAAKVRKKLSHVSLPPPLMGSLELVDLHFGDEAPFFTNTAFNGTSGGTGEFGFDFDLLYRGGFTLTLSVTLQVGPLKIPNLMLQIRIKNIAGKVHMSVGGPPSNKMWVGFHEAPELSLELKQDIHLPSEARIIASAIRGMDISGIVSDVVKVKLFEDMILPAMDDLPIPDLGPTPPSSPTSPAAANLSGGPSRVPQLSNWGDEDPNRGAAKTTPQHAAAAKKTAGPATTADDVDKQLDEHLNLEAGGAAGDKHVDPKKAEDRTNAHHAANADAASKTRADEVKHGKAAESPKKAATPSLRGDPAAADVAAAAAKSPAQSPAQSPGGASTASTAATAATPDGTKPKGGEGARDRSEHGVDEGAARVKKAAQGLKSRIANIVHHKEDDDSGAHQPPTSGTTSPAPEKATPAAQPSVGTPALAAANEPAVVTDATRGVDEVVRRYGSATSADHGVAVASHAEQRAAMYVVSNWHADLEQPASGGGGLKRAYVMQILAKKSESQSGDGQPFYLHCQWGVASDSVNLDVTRVECPSLLEAIRQFRKRFAEKTGNEWENRSTCDPKPGRYFFRVGGGGGGAPNAAGRPQTPPPASAKREKSDSGDEWVKDMSVEDAMSGEPMTRVDTTPDRAAPVANPKTSGTDGDDGAAPELGATARPAAVAAPASASAATPPAAAQSPPASSTTTTPAGGATSGANEYVRPRQYQQSQPQW